MAKNNNVFKFDVIERVITELDFTTKEEVLDFARTMRDIAVKNPDYTDEVKDAFKNAYKEIDEELTLANLKEIKKIINNQG